jgi:phenol hydroxylase P1 protein
MHIDIKAKEVKKIRETYSHVARRIGGDKPATRYQEGVYDIQAVANFHYRPTWEPDKELYDPTRTAIVMEDWYKFLDPRQYYYGNYCMARAKQQDSAEHNFKFVEKRNLMATLPEDVKQMVVNSVIPLRHYEWGANMNNYEICAKGYGTAITSAASLHGSDRLGNAQYITRIALALSENDTGILDQAKADWLEKPEWQGLRKAVEDSFVEKDWFKLFVVQNLVMDGLVHPLFFGALETEINEKGGSTYSMLTEFIVDWYAESARWVDKQIAVACAESESNKTLVSSWFNESLAEMEQALAPLAEGMLKDGRATMAEVVQAIKARAQKNGVNV